MSSNQSNNYKKINKIFQSNNHPQNPSVTNKRALKYKSSTVTEASLHHIQQRSKSTERSGGGNSASTLHHTSKNAASKEHGQKYNPDSYNGDMANNRLMRNYSSYELNRKPPSNNSFSSSSSRNGRTPSITSSSTTASHHLLRHPFTGKNMRSRSEDHLLNVSEERDCCNGSNSRTPCEECGEESPFYLHDPSTVGYNRLSDLFPQTSSDDSGLCLNSSSHSPNTHSSNVDNHSKRIPEKGFVNSTRFSDAYPNKTKVPSNTNSSKDSQMRTGRMVSRPRRAAPLPPIPVQSNSSRHYDHREESGRSIF